ncbi:MAG: TlpA disulfide reductase family protein [Gammaproteobacteria bacterium]|nr:TlpA disulfide reductase family protein [Gammaproteobacteria bacterium]
MRGLLLGLLMLAAGRAPAAAGEGMRPVEGRPAAAPLALPDLEGGTVRLADLRGRWVLVNFWAAWCAPCRREMPSMERAWRTLRPAGLELLAVHAGPSAAAARKFLDQVPVGFTVVVDEALGVAGWDIPGLPVTYLVDPRGRLAAVAVGDREWDSPAMIARLRELMGAEGD